MTVPRSRVLFVLASVALLSLRAGAQGQTVGTSAIAGVVVTTEMPPRPLARVLVTISGAPLKTGRTTVTDDDGRFTFSELPAGRFTLVAARAPYVKSAFGAKRPGRQGTPIDLAAGQHLADATIRMARGAAITGVIRSAEGEPAPDVIVAAASGSQTDPSIPSVLTDDRGVYRIFGLAPGRYVVSARVNQPRGRVVTQFSDAQMDDILAVLQRRSAGPGAGDQSVLAAMQGGSRASARDSGQRPATYGYAPIYYPGTADPDEAAVVDLTEGDERGGIDFGLQLVRSVELRGRVSLPAGVLPSATQIMLSRVSADGRAREPLRPAIASQRPDDAGAFRFSGVQPGRYRLMARAITSVPASPAAPNNPAPVRQVAAIRVTGTFWAQADIAIAGDDVEAPTLTLEPGRRVSGRLVFDTRAQAPPTDLTSVRIRLVDVSGGTVFAPMGSGRADGTFEIDGVAPGSYTVASPLSDAGWWLRSVVIGGRDVLDSPLDLDGSADVTGAIATFTDRHTELSGRLRTPANAAATDYYVLVISADRAFWHPGSRRVRFVRPSTDGGFTFRDLPAGGYLIAALTDLEPSDLEDVSFIEKLVPAALPVRLGDGEHKTQDLTLTR